MRIKNAIRHLLFLLGAAMLLLTAAPALGQLRTVPRALLDSLANPALAAGAEAMAFERTRIETGDIGEDDPPKSFTFRWRNAGNGPLVITRVKSTCGCAVATYDRRPVKPGESSEVVVTYHPKGHPGRFQRKIFLFTTLAADAPTATLELTGQVIPSTRPTYAYPYAKGPLLLKQQEIRLDGTALRTESIECLNGGDRTLRVEVDRQLLPACVEAEFSPAELAPGALGELTVRFDPSAGRVPQRIPILLKGLGLPPGQSSVMIRIDTDNDVTKQANN